MCSHGHTHVHTHTYTNTNHTHTTDYPNTDHQRGHRHFCDILKARQSKTK